MSAMDRRDFIRTGLATGAGAAVLGSAACVPGDLDRAGADDGGAFGIPDFPLEEVTLDGLASGLAAGSYSCREITEAYLGRIEALDRQGPACSRCSRPIRTRSRSQTRSTRSSGSGGREARCTGSRSCSRTTSTPPTG
jgi:hypothetical protein